MKFARVETGTIDRVVGGCGDLDAVVEGVVAVCAAGGVLSEVAARRGAEFGVLAEGARGGEGILAKHAVTAAGGGRGGGTRARVDNHLVGDVEDDAGVADDVACVRGVL